MGKDANKIRYMFRLGNSVNDKSRPLLVKQMDSSIKKAIFRNVRKLQENKVYNKGKNSYDLSRSKRECKIAQWNEAKNLLIAGKGDI